mgnify:FL=1
MENAIRNYIGSICLWASAPEGERKSVATRCMSHYFAEMTRYHGVDWVLVVDASFEARKAMGEGLNCIDATEMAFRRLRRGASDTA